MILRFKRAGTPMPLKCQSLKADSRVEKGKRKVEEVEGLVESRKVLKKSEKKFLLLIILILQQYIIIQQIFLVIKENLKNI